MIKRPLICKAQTYENIKLKKELWLRELDTSMNMFTWLNDEQSVTNDEELLTILDRHGNYWYNRFNNAWKINPQLACYYNLNRRWF